MPLALTCCITLNCTASSWCCRAAHTTQECNVFVSLNHRMNDAPCASRFNWVAWRPFINVDRFAIIRNSLSSHSFFSFFSFCFEHRSADYLLHVLNASRSHHIALSHTYARWYSWCRCCDCNFIRMSVYMWRRHRWRRRRRQLLLYVCVSFISLALISYKRCEWRKRERKNDVSVCDFTT